MAEKGYDSTEYLAQTFAAYLRRSDAKKTQGYTAKHRGESVEFRVANVACDLTFFLDKGKHGSTLKLQAEGKEPKEYDLPLVVGRSDTGRISGNNFEGYDFFFSKVVIEAIKEFSNPGYRSKTRL